MKRAAIIIGVNQTGNLPRLQAAVTSATEVCEWAKAQKFDALKSITDETEPVTVWRKLRPLVKTIRLKRGSSIRVLGSLLSIQHRLRCGFAQFKLSTHFL